MTYSVVASDLDGTLLNPQHRLSNHTKAVLKQLTDQGVHFIFATGRHHLDVQEMRNTLGIDAYMITSNGARIHDRQGKLIYSQDISPLNITELVNVVAGQDNIITHLYTDQGWQCDKAIDDVEQFFQESVFNFTLFNPADFNTQGIAKLFYTANSHEELLPLEEILNKRWGDQLNISFSSIDCLEVMAKPVSKGHALQTVVKQLGYQLADCIAFGDGMNDVEMLSMVGKGCIMQNAPQRLKQALPHLEVIGSNADEGVPNYLLQHLTS